MPRSFMLIALLAAAVGVPYLLNEGLPELPSLATPQASPPTDAFDTAASASQPQFEPKPLPEVSLGPNSDFYEQAAPVAAVKTHSLQQVLRMDITKEWVYGNWARKSTGLADPEFFGVRVPLVTGTQMSDLAGSLSYYFGRNDRVERIEFHGTTADTTQLVNLLMRQYGLRPSAMAPPGEQWFEVQGARGTESYLRTRPASVLWGNQPHQSFAVDLVLNRPGSGRKALVPTPQFTSVVPSAEASEAATSEAVFPGETLAKTTPPDPEKDSTDAEDDGGDVSVSLSQEELGYRGRKPTRRWPN